MARTPGTEAAGLFEILLSNAQWSSHYWQEQVPVWLAGNMSTESHPFQYHHSQDNSNWNGLTTEAVSAETVDVFKSKI